ncbi:MAG: hypothetical protein ABWY00_03960 [Dongiaceae bacterium]
MKPRFLIAVLFLASSAVAGSHSAEARDTRYELKIADVKSDSRYAESVPQTVTFYFDKQQPPKTGKDLGEFVTNRKTNSVGRPDEEACKWAMMSALKELGDRAVSEGGNAVINIVSYYKKNVFASDTLYECHAGAFVAGVALKGAVVKIDK